MDLNQITLSQKLNDNQIKFDQAEMERAILRAEQRRVRIAARLVWLRDTLQEIPAQIAELRQVVRRRREG
ncbi:MAG: hypothetical protein GKR98_01080 [Boseongicola sp.]|nr:MAG: hypothetical protein GKR98_01080 [Boseongicola sp.]